MASQQQLLAALQGLAQQSQMTAPQPRQTAPTSRTMAPARVAPQFGTLTSQIGAPPKTSLSPQTSMANMGLQNYAATQRIAYPKLTDQINNAAKGVSKPSGALGALAGILDNPIAKAALAPLTVLDTGRRAVISGVREMVDIMDTDKNTKASFGDWFKQTKDTSYGFGTAFPMKGNWGRAVGLVGDIALDPITWLTLGANIPEELMLRGSLTAEGIAARAVVDGAEELASLGPMYIDRMVAQEVANEATRVAASQEGIKVRALLGKHTTGRAFKTNLAGLVDKMGGSAELVQDIAKRGRIAIRTSEEGIALGEKLGIGKSGLYIMGTQKKIPFTGAIADALETGLVGARSGIMGSRGMEFLVENFMPKGTSASRNMVELRRGLSTGKMLVGGKMVKVDPEVARWAVRLEGADNAARILENQMLDSYAKIVKPMLEEPEIAGVGKDFFKFLDTPEFAADGTYNWPRQLSESETIAKDKIRAAFDQWKLDIEGKYQLVDKNFTMKGIPNYLPHMMTDEAKAWISTLSTARAEEILKYLKVNMTDPTSSFQARNLIKDAEFFGMKLSQKDVDQGIARLNQIARESNRGFTGDFFETDIKNIMRKYGQHYASQHGTAEFMRLAKEGGILAESKAMGSVTRDWINSIAKHAKDLENAVTVSHGAMAEAGKTVVNAIVDHLNYLGSEQGSVGKQLKNLLAEAATTGTPEETLIGLRNAKEVMLKAFNDRNKAWLEFQSQLEGQNHLIDLLDKGVKDSQDSFDELMKSVDNLVNNYAENTSRLGIGLTDVPGETPVLMGKGGKLIGIGQEVIGLDGEKTTLDKLIKTLDKQMAAADKVLAKNTEQWKKVMQLHNVMQDVIDGKINISSIGSTVYDEVLDIVKFPSKLRAKPLMTMNNKNIVKFWGGRDLSMLPEDIRYVRSVLDPEGKITAETLSKLTLNDVRERVARQATNLSDLADVKEAGVWLVVRDMMNDPELAPLLRKGITESGQEGATQTRFSNLVELIRQADVTEKYAYGEIGDQAAVNLDKANQRLANLEGQLDTLHGDEVRTVWAGATEAEDEMVYFGNWNEERWNIAKQKLEEKIANEKRGIAKLENGLSRHEVAAPRIATSLNGVRDVMADLSAGVSEYYLHRETVHNFKRLMQTLDVFGAAPTEKMYNAILASVAKPELDALLTFSNETKQLKSVFEDMRTKVNNFSAKKKLSQSDMTRIERELIDEIGGVPTARQVQQRVLEEMQSQNISRSNTMMEEVATIFRAKAPAKGKATKEVQALLDKQQLLRDHFPELEAVWLQSRVGTPDQLFYRHPQAAALEDAVIAELEKANYYQDWMKPASRRGRVTDFRGTGVDAKTATTDSSVYNYQKLRGHINSSIGKLERFYGEGNTTVKDLKTRYASIMESIAKEQVDATKAAENFVGTKNQRLIKRRLTALAKQQDGEFGYTGMLRKAFRGSDKSIDDFFGHLFGDSPVYEYSATLGKRQYRTLDSSETFFGKLDARIDSRKKGLTVLVDERDIPTSVLLEGKGGTFTNGKYVPGSWLLRKELRGSSALADALQEHADNLLARAGETQEYNSSIKAAQRELLASEAKTPIGPELPPRALAKETARNIVVQQQLDGLAATPQYTRALRRESEHAFAGQIARLDEKAALEIGFTPQEWSALWDEPMRQTNIGSIRSQRNSYLGQRKRLLAERGTLARTGKSTSAVEAKLTRVEEMLLPLEEQILQHESRGSALNKFAKLHDAFQTAEFQDALGIIPDGKPLKLEDAVRRFTNSQDSFANTSSVRSRRAFLKKSRESSEEFAFLKEYKTIEAKLDNSMQDSWSASKQRLLDRQEELRAEIARLNGDVTRNDVKVMNLQNDIMNQLEIGGLTTKSKYGTKLAKETNAIAENLRTDVQAPIRSGATKQVRANLKRQLVAELDREPTAEELNAVFAKFDESLKRVNDDYIMLDTGAIKGRQTPKQLEMAAEQRAIDAWKADLKAADKGVLGDKGLIRREFMPTTQSEETMKLLNNLRFDVIVEQGRQAEVLDMLSTMSTERRSILAQKMKQMKELQSTMDIKEKMVAPTSAGNRKIAKGKDVFAKAAQARKKAQQAFDAAVEFSEWGPKAIEETRKNMSDIEKMVKDGRYWLSNKDGTSITKKNSGWLEDVDQYIDDASYMMTQLDNNSIPNDIRRVVGNYVDARASWIEKTSELSVAQQEAAFATGLRGMEFAGAKLPYSLVGKVPADAYNVVKNFDEGFVQLSKYFPEVGVRKELAEIFQNVHRLNEPQMVRELSKFMGKYTKFFKAYATLSPGFHIRNGMSNSFMLFAAGADLKYLNEGLEMSKSWLAASKGGKTIEQWIEQDVPANLKQKARTSIDAFFGAGGGQTGDFFDKGLAPFGTKKSKEFGKWVENHSRFMLAWDGVSQGMDANGASARVRKFLIDYTDVSTADQYMRQIVPFWMWTSRNLPLQMGNMWLNPKAYAIYNSIKRNLSADEEGDIVPAWMKEIGAFKLPFGNNLYATPDLGFNRVGQTINELQDPARLLNQVNPLLRVPIELAGGRQFYNNRQFSTTPMEVGSGAGSVLQPILEAAGYGQTGPDGKKYVNDKAYYAIRNLIPFLGTAERLTPSIDTYQQRGVANPLMGFLGVPARSVTQGEMQSELKKRKKNIQGIVANEKAIGG